MALYPSQEWCDAWKNAMNNDPACIENGKNWALDWPGDFLFEVTPGSGLDKTHYIHAVIKGGKCLELKMLDSPGNIQPGFYVTGTYGDFKPVVKGEKDFIEGVVRGLFKLKGDMGKIMRNAKYIRAMAASISSFKNEYLGE
jgi:putative sterol carrier protein